MDFRFDGKSQKKSLVSGEGYQTVPVAGQTEVLVWTLSGDGVELAKDSVGYSYQVIPFYNRKGQYYEYLASGPMCSEMFVSRKEAKQHLESEANRAALFFDEALATQ